MKYNKKIVTAEFISRPNRFNAVVKLNREEITVHVPNTGRCRELLIPGCTVFLREELNRIGITLDIKNSFCTMHYYTDICRIGYNSYYGTYKWPKLEEVINCLCLNSKDIYNKTVSLFGESKEFHDSRYDITATYEIYNKINFKEV